MALPAEADQVVIQGYCLDEITGGGVTGSVSSVPIALTGQSTEPMVLDAVSHAHIQTRARQTTPDSSSGYWALMALSTNDPDLEAYGGRRVTLPGQPPRDIEVPYNAAQVTVTVAMAAQINPQNTNGRPKVGDTVRAIWFHQAAGYVAPEPQAGFLTSQQTIDLIAEAIATVGAGGGGGGSLTPTALFTSGSHTPASGELALYNPSSAISPALPAAAAGQRFGIANVSTGTANATFSCAGADTFSDGATSIVLAPGERAVLIGRSGGFVIESRTRALRLSDAKDLSVAGAAPGGLSALRRSGDGASFSLETIDETAVTAADVGALAALDEAGTSARTTAATASALLRKLTRYDTTAGAINQPIPPALVGAVFAVNVEAGANALTLTRDGSDVIGAAAATSVVIQPVPGTHVFHCTTAGTWRLLIAGLNLSALDARYAAAGAAASPADPYALAVGESTMSRLGLSQQQTVANGSLTLTYFTARKTETVAALRTISAAALAGSPTLCRVGVWEENPTTKDLTLVASIPNDPALWAGSNTAYSRALSAAWAKVAGKRYAIGKLVVGSTTPPAFYGPLAPNSVFVGTVLGADPRITGVVTGQTDLPASIAASSITSPAPRPFYAEMTL